MCKLRKLFIIAIFSLICLQSANCESNESGESDEDSTENSNDTAVVPQDLYVIKTIVYEVGILTDAVNDTDNSTESHEEVDVSFYDSPLNGSSLNLSNIPVPIQTNVSGVAVTGLLPGSDLVSILLPPRPILPKKQVAVTQNISTTNPEKGAEIISNLPKLLGLNLKKHSQKNNTEKESNE